jgi:hypothetical protein
VEAGLVKGYARLMKKDRVPTTGYARSDQNTLSMRSVARS